MLEFIFVSQNNSDFFLYYHPGPPHKYRYQHVITCDRAGSQFTFILGGLLVFSVWLVEISLRLKNLILQAKFYLLV